MGTGADKTCPEAKLQTLLLAPELSHAEGVADCNWSNLWNHVAVLLDLCYGTGLRKTQCRSAKQCNTVQHNATYFNMVQRASKCINVQLEGFGFFLKSAGYGN